MVIYDTLSNKTFAIKIKVMAKLVIEKLLKQKDLSKREFAKRLGMDYSNVQRCFKPSFDPRFSTLERCAKALGVKVRDLFEE